MKNCTCNKLDCDNTCLCACHRNSVYFSELKEMVEGLGRISEAVDICIENLKNN
jgi:hypothetical protein